MALLLWLLIALQTNATTLPLSDSPGITIAPSDSPGTTGQYLTITSSIPWWESPYNSTPSNSTFFNNVRYNTHSCIDLPVRKWLTVSTLSMLINAFCGIRAAQAQEMPRWTTFSTSQAQCGILSTTHATLIPT